MVASYFRLERRKEFAFGE